VEALASDGRGRGWMGHGKVLLQKERRTEEKRREGRGWEMGDEDWLDQERKRYLCSVRLALLWRH
jgi:hypothetical protein